MQDFVRALFDFDFRTFVTPAVVRPLYILAVVLICLFTALMLVFSLMSGQFIGVLLVPIGGAFYLVMTRMWAELAMVMFDMNDRLESLGGRRAEG